MQGDTLSQGNAYIRAIFHENPDAMQYSEWQQKCAEAYFIEEKRLEGLAQVLCALAKALFGKRGG